MSSVGSLSTSTSTSIRGYGGLASGLDRDELIQGMTIGTTTKINKQEQKKQQVQWMQEAVQSISDKMISFHGKYTETLTSPTNLFSGALWGRNKINLTGANSSKVSVSGTSLSGKGVTIMGVKQRAENAKWASSGSVSDNKLETGVIDTSDLAKIAGKALTFSYNGTSKTVTTLGEAELTEIAGEAYQKSYDETYKAKLQEQYATEYENALQSAKDAGKTEADAEIEAFQTIEAKAEAEGYKAIAEAAAKTAAEDEKNQAMIDAIADSLEKQLQSTFGKDRIRVSGDGGKISFETTIPGGGSDSSSVLTLTGVEVGAEALNIMPGKSTRLDLSKTIADAGINGLTQADVDKLKNADGQLEFDINGAKVKVDADATVKDLMDAINNSDANVTVAYNDSTDKFTFASKDNAASGKIDFSGNDDPEKQGTIGKIFGLDFSEGTLKRGTDAVFSVRYEDSDEIVELRRDSNTFEVDGLSIELKGRFGYDGDSLAIDKYGDVDESNAVGISATADVDKLVDTIKSFVEEYNAIVDLVNTELTTKHEKDYTPLSSEQKSELSDDEVEKWETKAKTGLLYGDSDLRSLSMDLRTVATSYVWQLEQVGISVSSTYSDNGKLSVDETKLRSALEKDPGSVEKLFTAKEGVGEDGKPIYNGVATNLKDVMEKYVKTTGDMDHKGILIRKAGSKSSAMSMTENYYYDQIQSIEKLIDSLNDRLETERDRYIKQFSTLESLIANMNSQSSYLSSMSGY